MNIKNKIFKKDKGTVIKNVITLLCFLMFAYLVISGLESVLISSKKNKIDDITRNYMLKMETEGYLTPELENGFIRELTELEITNISTVGSTKTDIGYGNDIYLMFKGTTKVLAYNMNDKFEIVKTLENVEVSRTKKSTSKN